MRGYEPRVFLRISNEWGLSLGPQLVEAAVRTGDHTYLFEFKVAETSPPGSALTQLQERDYAAKYRAGGHPIHLIGVEFSRQTRNITAFDTGDG